MDNNLQCDVIGIGAWGPGFADWQALQPFFVGELPCDATPQKAPKPEVIPANERRRAPMPVKMAVEVSSQALAQAGIESSDVACVFGSGLGDTEITDYMCRVLTTEQKQLSPTKFHNSVHNAAAGYWTISTDCMKSANSVAAYYETAAVALLEAMVHCDQENEPVLITLFDTKAHAAYRDVFDCDQPFAAALLICPKDYVSDNRVIASLAMNDMQATGLPTEFDNKALADLFKTNPAARVLSVLEAIHKLAREESACERLQMKLSDSAFMTLEIK